MVRSIGWVACVSNAFETFVSASLFIFTYLQNILHVHIGLQLYMYMHIVASLNTRMHPCMYKQIHIICMHTCIHICHCVYCIIYYTHSTQYTHVLKTRSERGTARLSLVLSSERVCLRFNGRTLGCIVLPTGRPTWLLATTFGRRTFGRQNRYIASGSIIIENNQSVPEPYSGFMLEKCASLYEMETGFMQVNTSKCKVLNMQKMFTVMNVIQ